jgi:hypothetical protein
VGAASIWEPPESVAGVLSAALIRKAVREPGMLADVAIRGEDAPWMAAATPPPFKTKPLVV